MPETEFVEYEGLRLPPRHMTRHGGKTDADHVRSAKEIVRRVSELCGLTPDHRVLDIGCGAGRFLIGMQATFGDFRQYLGLDVRRQVIDWAQSALAEPSGRVSFEWLDVQNARYNRKGSSLPGKRVFPVDDASFDVLTLFSVFSHMTLEDIDVYLYEFRRVMAPGGKVYCTGFFEEDVPDWEENPPGYLFDWKGPLHCVRINRQTFERMVANAGLKVDAFVYRHAQGRQSTFVLSLA
jgi:ubiquinone/menaquinone biosynthesis C-methylase UbiE